MVESADLPELYLKEMKNEDHYRCDSAYRRNVGGI
jgi:hypothetical protein